MCKNEALNGEECSKCWELRCYTCHELGHYAAQCPWQWDYDLDRWVYHGPPWFNLGDLALVAVVSLLSLWTLSRLGLWSGA